MAEECQHMAMFNNWVRINSDIETVDAGEADWGKVACDFTQDLATRLPEAFWVQVLLFEFVGDDFNQAMKKDPSLAVGIDGRPLHPILVAMGKAHTGEEARHIGYARKWLHEGMALVDEAQIAEIQSFSELSAQVIIDRQSLLPLRYTSQLSRFMTKDEFKSALGVSPARRLLMAQLKKLLEEFTELRIIRQETMAKWVENATFS